jgi:hypothetical protein
LGAFAGAQKSRDCNGRQQRDDGDNDHDFNQREAGMFGLKFSMHGMIAFGYYYLLWAVIAGSFLRFSRLIPCHSG